jgi:hypothetical protein
MQPLGANNQFASSGPHQRSRIDRGLEAGPVSRTRLCTAGASVSGCSQLLAHCPVIVKCGARRHIDGYQWDAPLRHCDHDLMGD